MSNQTNLVHYASDALLDALVLAKQRSLNAVSFNDAITLLNECWRTVYDALALQDSGYYSTNVRLTKKLTHLPAFVRNSVQVYSAQSPTAGNRNVYRAAGPADLSANATYAISGNDLYCPDAERLNTVWLTYVPACPQLFFTLYNRDPLVLQTEPQRKCLRKYYVYDMCIVHDDQLTPIDECTKEELQTASTLLLKHRSGNGAYNRDISELLTYMNENASEEDGYWAPCFISCDAPYIFVTYYNAVLDEYRSGYFTNMELSEFVPYNPFAFTGRVSNVEYLSARWNDATGMGVTIYDHDDDDCPFKSLGWTSDTKFTYPGPECYSYFVALLAARIASMLGDVPDSVERAVAQATADFNRFAAKDKSSWQRVENVNPANIMDFIV